MDTDQRQAESRLPRIKYEDCIVSLDEGQRNRGKPVVKNTPFHHRAELLGGANWLTRE